MQMTSPLWQKVMELEHLHFCLILLTGTNPWQDPTSQGRGVCSTYSGRAWQNRMAMGVEMGRRPFLPSTCIIIIVAVWATLPDPGWISGPLHPFISLSPFPPSEVPCRVAISPTKPQMSSVTKDASRLPAEFFVLKSCHWPFPDMLGHF